MERKPILDIKIDMMGESVHLKSENGEVVMIPFKGSVDCELFKGIVEPCGWIPRWSIPPVSAI